MNNPAPFLRSAHLRARRLLLVWSLGLAALGAALVGVERLGWARPPVLLAPAFGLTALAVLIFWIRHARRASPARLARELDAGWTLSARLESATELAADSSGFAAAQRADAAARLAGRRPPRAPLWFTGLGLVAVATLLLLVQTGVLALRLAAPQGSASAAAPATPPDVSATLEWRTPKPEIKATAIEEVPLAATARTHTGLRSVTLEVSVNGEPRLSRPLEAAALAPLNGAGEHPIELSLYLDELSVQEFDLVSYHLRAERIVPQVAGSSPQPSLPPVTSPLQFVQIRPPREDVTRVSGGAGSELQKLALLVGNLKAAQLQLLKQNHLLAHDPLDHSLPAWREENARVAGEQGLLAQKTAEARDFAIAEQLPAIAVDHLGQAGPLMSDAAARIAATDNSAAAQPQGRALALITAIEKALRKIIAEGGGPGTPPPQNHDPFKDDQQFKLPPRADTPAGELEALATDQAGAAADPDAAARDFLAKQAEIARRLAALEKAHTLDPAAQGKAAEAARDAAEAVRQLEADDTRAALAPANAAAQALGEAVAAQEKTGRATAEAQLENARRELNAADRLDDLAARVAARREVAAALRAEAAAQQQTGSAEAARRLAEAAAKIDRAADTPSGQGQGKGQARGEGKGEGSSEGQGEGEGKGDSSGSPAAEAATQAQAALAPRAQSLSRAIRQIKPHSSSSPGASNGRGAGGRALTPGTPAGDAVEMELGAQLAAELLANPADRELARQLGEQLREPDTQFGFKPELLALADKVLVRLEAARQAGQRDEQIRRFNAEDLDPAYRPAVEEYFEKLSREGAKP